MFVPSASWRGRGGVNSDHKSFFTSSLYKGKAVPESRNVRQNPPTSMFTWHTAWIFICHASFCDVGVRTFRSYKWITNPSADARCFWWGMRVRIVVWCEAVWRRACRAVSASVSEVRSAFGGQAAHWHCTKSTAQQCHGLNQYKSRHTHASTDTAKHSQTT